MNNKSDLRCKTCKFFTGAGDWNLCCTKPHPDDSTIFGFLCYETTPACNMYEEKDNCYKQ